MEVSRQAKAEEPRAESSQTVYSSSWIAILTPARPQAPRRLLFLTLAPSLPSWLQLLRIQSTSIASPGETEGQRDSSGAAAASRSKSRWNWQSLYPAGQLHALAAPSEREIVQNSPLSLSRWPRIELSSPILRAQRHDIEIRNSGHHACLNGGTRTARHKPASHRG